MVAAIDVHAHIGAYRGAALRILDRFMSATPALVAARAREAGIALVFVSPLRALLPRGHGHPVTGNREAARDVARNPQLRQWVVVDPCQPATYRQAARMLQNARCIGIKIHPEEHRYPIRRYGRELLRFAAEHGAVVQSHSGERKSLPEDFVPFANEFPEVSLLLSHLGCGWDDDPTHQVRAIQQSRHGNIFTDTSSARSILPGLLEWAVQEVGADRILFGTDTPCYFTAMQRARIDHAAIPARAKDLILRDNALRIFRGKIVIPPANAPYTSAPLSKPPK
jgi:predicted TIM-barrel fold metal-dependent hydrolase